MNLVLVKYNAGNVQSVLYALERIGIEATVTDDPETIKSADKVLFPGVGEASTAMRYLKERKLDVLIRDLKQPVFGICLGMQLLCSHSEENDTACIGVFEERVKRFNPPALLTSIVLREDFKVPQIGWNTIYDLQSDLFRHVKEKSFIYLVHSYYASIGEHTIATTEYIQPFSAGLHKNNFYGVQFHPEKSAEAGEQILRNFVEYVR